MENKKGFTLAELLIVVAIIGVLVAISIPIFTSQLEKSRQAVDLANMRSAKAAAVAEWMTDGMPENYSKKYDAASGTMTDSTPKGYGKSSKNSSEFASELNATGTPNDGTVHFITVKIDSDGIVSLKWGGNDLTTAAGRRQEDIDNMNAIESAFKKAYENGEINFYKNFNQISVYSNGDGTAKDYRVYIDTWGYATQETIDAEKQKLVDLVESTGININSWQVYSSDEKWKYGYTINIDKDGVVSVYANSKGSSSSDGGYWYRPNYITTEDRE
ncbi:MAG: prepilin-type N-terminal cleavage/methylation domain-containing protein [Solobacterium sp.]|nr:prepilin-type N-terminal cleavage/methylation domain-containing protein [Solobacterium sp.]